MHATYVEENRYYVVISQNSQTYTVVVCSCLKLNILDGCTCMCVYSERASSVEKITPAVG